MLTVVYAPGAMLTWTGEQRGNGPDPGRASSVYEPAGAAMVKSPLLAERPVATCVPFGATRSSVTCTGVGGHGSPTRSTGQVGPAVTVPRTPLPVGGGGSDAVVGGLVVAGAGTVELDGRTVTPGPIDGPGALPDVVEVPVVGAVTPSALVLAADPPVLAAEPPGVAADPHAASTNVKAPTARAERLAMVIRRRRAIVQFPSVLRSPRR